MQKIALWLALGALGVNAPRFVILFLKVDGISLPPGLEGFLLAVTGVATGAVLSGGGAYIAYVLAHPTRGGRVRTFLHLSWILLLVFNVVLLAPMMVVALRMSELAYVLSSPGQQWLWSITAIIAVEWLAAGAMAAYALLDHNRHVDPPDDLWGGLAGGLGMNLPFGIPNLSGNENGGAPPKRKKRQPPAEAKDSAPS